MNGTHIKYQFLNNLREPSFTFWTMIYPLLMALLFFVAFQGLIEPKPLDIRVGVEPGSPAAPVLASVDFLTVAEMDGQRGSELVAAGDLTGYVDRDLNVSVLQSGINETVLVSVISQMKQMQALAVPLENYEFETSYIQSRSARANPFMIPFYSLLGMVSLYSVYMGLEFGRIVQADQSMEALRMNVVPLRKQDFILGSLIIGIGLNLFSNLLLLAFMKFILHMDLISDPLRSMAVIGTANLVGIMLGLFIGAFSRISDGAKNGIVIAVTLFLSFLSGMMSPDIRILIEEHAPLVNRFNPVNIVTTQMVRLNYLGQTASFPGALGILAGWAALFMGLSILLLRRRTYDSI